MGQDPISILRFSRVYPYGTARSMAMGGAFGALGGDLSAIHVNPGGAGVFRNSEFNFTPALDFDRATSGSAEDSKNAFLIGNLGATLHFPFIDSKWRGINFSFNYVNLNNFNRRIIQPGGHGNTSSMTEVWQAQANGNATNTLESVGLDPYFAYETMLIDLRPNATDDYAIPLDWASDRVSQHRYITEHGYQGEYAVAVGANFDDMLYIGAAIGTPYIRYKTQVEYVEEVDPAGGSPLTDFTRLSVFESNGSGVNFKIGAILRPISALRLGLAIHTPTFYRMAAYDELGLYSTFSQPPLPGVTDTRFSKSRNASYDYDLVTPWRFVASAAVVVGKRAIISADYEFTDYPTADVEDTYRGEYDWIRDFFKYNTRAGHDLRLGAEIRATSFLSARAGYAYHGSPYAKGDWNEKNHVQTYSAGLGFNFGAFYLDAAYLRKHSRDIDYFYNYDDGVTALRSPEIRTTFRANEFRCSLGVKF
jgi:hypothetical protein